MQAYEEVLTQKEIDLVDALDRFEMKDSQFLAVCNLMEERDDLIQQMLDWIAANPDHEMEIVFAVLDDRVLELGKTAMQGRATGW